MKQIKSKKKPLKLSKKASSSSKKKRLIKVKSSKRESELKNNKASIKNKKMKKSAMKQISTRLKRRKATSAATATSAITTSTIAKPIRKNKIVRIMGQGQFTVDNNTLKKLNEIDDSIVQLVSKDRSDDAEFRKRLTELTDIVERKGKPLDPKEIIQSDIILPSADLSIDEAKKLFKGDGVIPETEV